MLLLIDAGNTRVKWALLKNRKDGLPGLGRWIASGNAAHEQVRELGETWREHSLGRVLISNVAGAAMRDALEGALGMQPVPLEWFSSTAAMGGVRNMYRDPAQLGCDRFASAIGAHALFPKQALVIATCGTATTVDAVDEDGVFLGGMILPGLGLMASSLARNTAQLPQVAATPDAGEAYFADHTDAAIANGCMAAQAGAIERALATHRRRHGEVRCVLSGGAAALIAPHLSVMPTQVENLVLIGLHHVAMST